MSKVQEVLDMVKDMTVLELADLVKAFEEEFGVSAAAPVAAAPAAAATGAPAEAEEEEQTAFDAVLSDVGDKKIQVIKVVREITGLGLKEAKELVDSAPKPIKEQVDKEEADSVKTKLAEVGGTVEVK